jgi:hypothetical protein
MNCSQIGAHRRSGSWVALVGADPTVQSQWSEVETGIGGRSASAGPGTSTMRPTVVFGSTLMSRPPSATRASASTGNDRSRSPPSHPEGQGRCGRGLLVGGVFSLRQRLAGSVLRRERRVTSIRCRAVRRGLSVRGGIDCSGSRPRPVKVCSQGRLKASNVAEPSPSGSPGRSGMRIQLLRQAHPRRRQGRSPASLGGPGSRHLGNGQLTRM